MVRIPLSPPLTGIAINAGFFILRHINFSLDFNHSAFSALSLA